MVDPNKIVEQPLPDSDDASGHESDGNRTPKTSGMRKRSKKLQDSDPSHGPIPTSPVHVPEEIHHTDESVAQRGRLRANSTMRDEPLTQEDYRARFYSFSRKVAEEYDKEFLKKYDEDLNTTLIFAGLFSAVTSAFIIQVDSQLQPDPNNETAALLRVLIYKIDNTTFGINAPTLPQWSGPPRAMVHVQSILFASLSVSLFSAFLAMLGKQWLNRYDSTDTRGSAIERSQSRQRKLDGIVAWYFDHVMESLPLILQGALLLLDCALSRYLWEIDTTIALVVLGVASSGAIFYLSIVFAGTVSENCPYQTPGSHIFRYIFGYARHSPLPALLSAPSAIAASVSAKLSSFVKNSWYHRMFINRWWSLDQPWYSMSNAPKTLRSFLLTIFVAPVIDAFCLGRSIFLLLVAFSKKVYYRSFGGMIYRWFVDTSPRTRGLDRQQITSDLRCIPWLFQTSLDKDVHLSTLKRLALMSEFSHFHPSLVADCFNAFVGCINVINGKMVTIQGLEQLAIASASAFFRTFHNLVVVNPTSEDLADLHRRYHATFPSGVDFTGLAFHTTMTAIHTLAGRFGNPRYIWWDKHRRSSQEHTSFSQRMVQAAKAEYRQMRHREAPCVPRWVLHSALHFLHLGSVFPPSITADYLTIIALDLGCDAPDAARQDESVQVEQLSNLITEKLENMVGDANQDLIFSKRKAIYALFPYAILLEQGGHQGMVDLIFRASRASLSGKFMWRRLQPYITSLFDEPSPPSLDRVVALVSPHIRWNAMSNGAEAVTRWAAAAMKVQYTEDVGQSVVDALLQIACNDSLRRHVPAEIWEWLKRRPPLPPECQGRRVGTSAYVVSYIQGLGDPEILKSYFLLVWSEWDSLRTSGLDMMQISIREVFGDFDANRSDLVRRLDHVLGELDQGLEYLKQRKPGMGTVEIQVAKRDYRKLGEVLQEAGVDVV